MPVVEIEPLPAFKELTVVDPADKVPVSVVLLVTLRVPVIVLLPLTVRLAVSPVDPITSPSSARIGLSNTIWPDAFVLRNSMVSHLDTPVFT